MIISCRSVRLILSEKVSDGVNVGLFLHNSQEIVSLVDSWRLTRGKMTSALSKFL